MQMVLRRTVILLGAGAAVGIPVALAAGGLLSPILYNVSPRDPGAFALGGAVMAAVAFGAAWLPALRASHIEPASALRDE